MHRRRRLVRPVLLAVAAVVLVSGCDVFFPVDHFDEGGLIYNATDEDVFIYAAMDDGEEIRLGGIQAGTSGSVPDPCQDRALTARHRDDGPIVDTWDVGSFCVGDYWSIPGGARIENRSGRTQTVRALDPGSDSFYTIRIEDGGVGTLRAPCADPPITAGADVPPRDEPLCAGDTWVIEP